MSITCPKDATLSNFKNNLQYTSKGGETQTLNYIQENSWCAHQKGALERSLHPVEYIGCVVVSACRGEDGGVRFLL